jgi:4-hydroxybenzoate polyprenyltransferase
VASAHRLEVTHLPWRPELLKWLDVQRAAGRQLVLATAANERIAHDVANHLGLFDKVLASNEARNLKGRAKLAAIQREIGDRFAYAGDHAADLPIWQAASSRVVVDAAPRVAAAVRALGNVELEVPRQPRDLALWLRAIRAHQWVKNILLFVPLLTSFAFVDVVNVVAAFKAFIAFSLAASATYLLNDLWDLDNDRQHERKRARPMASGRISLLQAVIAAASLLAVSIGIAGTLSQAFVAMLVGYVVLTTLYSWVLKTYVLLDVLMLALLYTYRVLTGAVVVAVTVSPWLFAFSGFTFLSLALVKRCSELVSLQQKNREYTKGRDYRVADLVVLWPLGVGASLCSIVVFGLFVGSPEALATYGDTRPLWLAGLGLVYWTGRMWIKTARGEMHDDPIVFALRDKGSRLAILAIVLVPLAVHFIR